MVDVDTVNMDGDCGEQRRAIAFAAGDIEDCLTGHEGPGERISVPVLVRDLARALGQESFAGERCFVSASGGDLRIAGHEGGTPTRRRVLKINYATRSRRAPRGVQRELVRSERSSERRQDRDVEGAFDEPDTSDRRNERRPAGKHDAA